MKVIGRTKPKIAPAPAPAPEKAHTPKKPEPKKADDEK